jgi:integrase
LIVLDVEQSRQFIAAISGHEYEALFALAITTGMRPSEYLALTWSDFDFQHGAVSISKGATPEAAPGAHRSLDPG